MASNTIILNHLKALLGNEVEPDIVSYISGMKHIEDLDEFMESILDKNNSAHLRAYNGIKDVLFNTKPAPNNSPSSNQNSNGVSKQNKKEKKKFKDINSYQQKAKEKTGRCACDCMGQEHEFMQNCLQCGRIHCMEEGPGPCLFCGNPVNIRGAETLDVTNRKQKNSTRHHRENKVFDDDNDYFKINSSKTNGDKASKQKMVVALDFATRRVIESTQEDVRIRERLLQDSMDHLKKVEQVYKNLQQLQHQAQSFRNKRAAINDELVDLLIQMRHKKPVGKEEDIQTEDDVMPVIDYGTTGFDEDLLASIDHGLCLSMHQPYASLLVAGVKKHEGRTWPTTHRGRLWIAAAAKVPDEDEMDALENFYREYYQDTTLKFPKDYPTSCLLGCVYVEDCLEQEVYRKKFPNGESTSPFVLICTNPIILPIFYPVVGKHKIYPLEKDVHKCAKLAMQHAKYVM